MITSSTGSILLFMKYLMQPMDEYAVINHPWQPIVLKFHIISAPFMILGLGYLLAVHVLPILQRKVKESLKTGFSLLMLILPMVVSGYMIQLITSEFWLSTTAMLHIAFSVFFLFSYFLHYLVSKRINMPRKVSIALLIISLSLLPLFF